MSNHHDEERRGETGQAKEDKKKTIREIHLGGCPSEQQDGKKERKQQRMNGGHEKLMGEKKRGVCNPHQEKTNLIIFRKRTAKRSPVGRHERVGKKENRPGGPAVEGGEWGWGFTKPSK